MSLDSQSGKRTFFSKVREVRDFFAALGSALAGFFFIRPLGFVLSLFTRSSTKEHAEKDVDTLSSVKHDDALPVVTSLIEHHSFLVAQQRSNVTKIQKYFQVARMIILDNNGRPRVESLPFIDTAINLYHLLTICERLTILDQLNAHHVIADEHLVTSMEEDHKQFSSMIRANIQLCVKVLRNRYTKLLQYAYNHPGSLSLSGLIYISDLRDLKSDFLFFACKEEHKLPDISERKIQLAKFLQSIDVTEICRNGHDHKEYTSIMIKHHRELAVSLEDGSITEALADASMNEHKRLAPCREHIDKVTPYDNFIHEAAKQVCSAAETDLPRTTRITISNADAITVSTVSLEH